MLKFVSSSGSHVSATVPEKYSNENPEQSVELQKDTKEISLSAKTQETESIQSNTDRINYAAGPVPKGGHSGQSPPKFLFDPPKFFWLKVSMAYD